MTVSSSTNVEQFACNGSTVAFPFQPVFFQLSDLLVVLFNTATNLPVTPAPVLNGLNVYDYVITGNQDAASGEYLSGGTVVFNNAPPGGYIVTIQREVAATQQSSFADNTLFPAKAVEAALDRLTMLAQQALQWVINAITAPLSDVNPQLVLPAAGLRANKVLGFDAQGNVQTIPMGDQSGETVQAAGGATAATLAQRFSYIYNAKTDFGAVGNGVADDTYSLRLLISALETQSGGEGYIPPGTYCVAATLFITASDIKLRGAGGGSSHNAGPSAAATRLVWIGPSNGGTLMSVAPTGTLALYDICVTDMMLDAGAGCSVGLNWTSTNDGEVDIYGLEFSSAAFETSCANTLSEAASVQNNVIRVRSRNFLTAGGNCVLGGNGTSNTSFNDFAYLEAEHLNGNAFVLQRCDNNKFRRLRAFMGEPPGTGIALFLEANSLFPDDPGVSSNSFDDVSPGAGGVFSQGTDEGMLYPARDNEILYYDVSNGSPTPIIGTGSQLSWSSNLAPTGWRSYSLTSPATPGNPTFVGVEASGIIKMSGLSGTIASGTTGTITLPMAINGAQDAVANPLPPVAGNAGPWAVLVNATQLLISNYGTTACTYYWKVEAR